MTEDLYESAWKFVQWTDQIVTSVARGDTLDVSDAAPKSRFWLGRLATESEVIASPLGARAEKLDPCAIGIRVRPATASPTTIHLTASFRCWVKVAAARFEKSEQIVVGIPVTIQSGMGSIAVGEDEFRSALLANGLQRHAAEFRIDYEGWRERPELVVSLVNTGEIADKAVPDTHLYEAELTIQGLPTHPFELESIPDSFRYDRAVPAIGVNCGVQATADQPGFRTTDTVVVDRARPVYWSSPAPIPDLSFRTLSNDPVPQLSTLVEALEAWGAEHWNLSELEARSGPWTDEMRADASDGKRLFSEEVERLKLGVQTLRDTPALLDSFRRANSAMLHSSRGKYDKWRPFQVGFLVSALPSITDPSDSDIVDTVWFATGGGKTETYLGLLLTSIFYDRAAGKVDGISAWTRFPLRLLSLQQTQRFADALAGAELIRRRDGLPGAPISLGYFVGNSSTPNRIVLDPSASQPSSLDPSMPARYQVLLRCPFCGNEDLTMKFDRATWRLQHMCLDPSCPWPEPALPFYVVDDEVYRFLPTVVVGTLDKAALVSMQSAMRGFFGPPLGVCDRPGHGYSYAARSKNPSGCLVPGCKGTRQPVSMAPPLWAPRYHLQDELHLLRDSLGAVDSHYETLLDFLQQSLTGTKAKIVASSATLSGFERQVGILYGRRGRVFPQPGPSLEDSFWSTPSGPPARRYVAVAPRGVTMEFVADRTLNALQECVRRLVDSPDQTCADLQIPVAHADHLIRLYGVDVVYGNTVRDVEASRRSAETEFDSPINAETLTGGTPFEDVRTILDRLDHPEPSFSDRIHLIAASSMISHGVDIDRFNVMVMKGLPLTTAEFIQTSARVGRRWPGIVYVLHRITREREVATYAQFANFIVQGDRFVEPIPVTRSSRRVLALTASGAEEAMRLAIHETPSSGALTTIRRLRDHYRAESITAESESAALTEALGLTGPLDGLLRQDVREWAQNYFNALNDPATQAKWPNELSPSGPPMRSLRDVEEPVPIFGDD